MAARSKARKRALDILFESELQGLEVGATLARRVATTEPSLNEYAVALVEGIVAHRERIDEVIGRYASGWTLERMPTVDRNVLRIGTFEIMYRDDVPDAVAMSEAVSLVRELSTDESPGFVNGLLAQVSAAKRTHST